MKKLTAPGAFSGFAQRRRDRAARFAGSILELRSRLPRLTPGAKSCRPLRGLLLVSFLCAATLAAQETISLGEYRQRLEVIEIYARTGQIREANEAAASLLPMKIQSQAGFLQADSSVLKPIIEATTTDALFEPASRLKVLVDELQSSQRAPGKTADKLLLERLRRSEQAPGLRAGGKIASIPIRNESGWERAGKVLTRFFEWIGKILQKIADWLEKFWPDFGREGERQKKYFGIPAHVALMMAVIVALLLLLALITLRKSRRARPDLPASTSAIISSRDADPLSREANEWETYAAELARAGKFREAIRAWYHAVLVSLYRAGILHYRKGRTNWEYVSALPYDVAWRPAFVAITRHFEREWYGHELSSEEALETCRAGARGILSEIRGGRG